jgi:hypothetical protein
MKKFTKAQIKELNELTEKLRENVGGIEETLAALQEKIGAYNDAVVEFNTFRQGIEDDMQNYFDEKSEKWQDGDAGQNYQAWIEEWNTDIDELEEVNMDIPGDADEIEQKPTEVES